ncbi:MAG TPA: prolipoprotein diacylglyceryl transferase, partial [Ilumatobacteraceae bacterium]|nr:prolipoprotein diacylglyceryl transferase [Ilumatobacteraceae bacterium]
GIPGGLIFGIGVGVWYFKRKGIPVGLAVNSAAPAIAVAQAIGRWGNYFNQELYGRVTTLPWGLEIDDAKRTGDAAQYVGKDVLFHPTFLYESLANLALAAGLIVLDRKRQVRPGHLLAMYIVGYGVIRFFVEGLRIDEADHVAGLRWNQWMALAAVVGGLIYLAVSSRRPLPAADEGAEIAETASPEAGSAEIAEDIDDIDDIDGSDIEDIDIQGGTTESDAASLDDEPEA